MVKTTEKEREGKHEANEKRTSGNFNSFGGDNRYFNHFGSGEYQHGIR